MEHCGTCKHYRELQPNQGGLCRRYPPTVLVVPATIHGQGVQLAGQFPPTNPDEVCGEYSVVVSPLKLVS